MSAASASVRCPGFFSDICCTVDSQSAADLLFPSGLSVRDGTRSTSPRRCSLPAGKRRPAPASSELHFGPVGAHPLHRLLPPRFVERLRQGLYPGCDQLRRPARAPPWLGSIAPRGSERPSKLRLSPPPRPARTNHPLPLPFSTFSSFLSLPWIVVVKIFFMILLRRLLCRDAALADAALLGHDLDGAHEITGLPEACRRDADVLP